MHLVKFLLTHLSSSMLPLESPVSFLMVTSVWTNNSIDCQLTKSRPMPCKSMSPPPIQVPMMPPNLVVPGSAGSLRMSLIPWQRKSRPKILLSIPFRTVSPRTLRVVSFLAITFSLCLIRLHLMAASMEIMEVVAVQGMMASHVEMRLLVLSVP